MSKFTNNGLVRTDKQNWHNKKKDWEKEGENILIIQRNETWFIEIEKKENEIEKKWKMTENDNDGGIFIL